MSDVAGDALPLQADQLGHHSQHTRCTHEEALDGPRIVQWSRFVRNPGHATALFGWHTFCLCADTATAAVVFVYGWIQSMVPWPFIIPAVGYTMINVGTVVVYIAFGPLRVNTSPMWQPVGPIQAIQSLTISLVTVFLPIAKVRAPVSFQHGLIVEF